MKNFKLSEKVYAHVERIDHELLGHEVKAEYVGEGVAEGYTLRNILTYLTSQADTFASSNKLGINISYTSEKIYAYIITPDGNTVIANVGLYDEVINIPEEVRAKVFAEQHLNGVMPKRYGCKSDGTMTKEGLVKWLYHATLKQHGLAEKYLKEWLEKLKEKTYYLYKIKNCMPEVACLIAERTNTSSCMTDSSIDWTVRKFNYFATNKDGQQVWVHPFRAYEGLDTDTNCMLCVSTLPPEKVLGQTHDKIPFIARGFSDGEACARWYGSSEQDWRDVFEDLITADTPWGIKLYGYNVQGNKIAPYVDGGLDANDNYLNALNKLRVVNEDCTPRGIEATIYEMYDRAEDEDDETGGYWRVEPHNAVVYFFEPVTYHTCAITGNEYREDEEELIYVEDLNDWVEGDFARWDADRGMYVLDGLEVYNYYNR